MEEKDYPRQVECFVLDSKVLSLKDKYEGIRLLFQTFRQFPPDDFPFKKIVPDVLVLKKCLGNSDQNSPMTRQQLANYVKASIWMVEGKKTGLILERGEYVSNHILTEKDPKKIKDNADFANRWRTGEKENSIPKSVSKRDNYQKIEDYLLEYGTSLEKNKNQLAAEEYLIQLIIALGLDLGVFEKFLQQAKKQKKLKAPEEKQENKTPEKLPDDANVERAKKANRPRLLYVLYGLVTFALVGLGVHFLHPSASPGNATANTLRPRIAVNNLFKESKLTPFHVPASSDSLQIFVEKIYYEDGLAIEDTIPAGRLWLKLWLVNVTPDMAFFPDALIIVPQPSYITAGTSFTGVDYQGLNPRLNASLTCDQHTPLEWILESDGRASLPPGISLFTIIEISGEGDCIKPFEIQIRYHDHVGNSYTANGEEIFKIACRYND